LHILDIENHRRDLLDKIGSNVSAGYKVLLINNFFDCIFNSLNPSIINSYTPEFIESYIFYLQSYDPFFAPPSEAEKVLNTLKRLREINLTGKYNNEISAGRETVSKRLNELNIILSGKGGEQKPGVFFPLTETEGPEGYGIMDSVTVKIHPATTEDNFIIIPSEREIEARLHRQVVLSWQTASGYLKNFNIKLKGGHSVYISFDKRAGFYSGNSFGPALYLSFLQELLIYYKSPFVIQSKVLLAVTGGLDSAGTISPVSDPVIRKKAEIVFFSPAELFIVPREDEQSASEVIEEMKTKYPERKISVMGVSSVSEIINRRDIIDIRREKLIKRVNNFAKRNPLSIIAPIITLLILFAYSTVVWDVNPATYDMKGETLRIKNMVGQTLWTQKMSFSVDNVSGTDLQYRCCRIVDINNDGKNEVIVSLASSGEMTNNQLAASVICFDRQKTKVWEYTFRDIVTTESIQHSTSYLTYLIDTLTENGSKIIYCIGRNIPLYPNAVYKIDVQTGMRVDSVNTLWHSGGICYAVLGDFNRDGRNELAAAGVNNGLERAFFFTIDIDKMNGQLPTAAYYTFNGILQADYSSYILFPQTDYSYFYRNRMNVATHLYYYSSTREFIVSVREDYLNSEVQSGLVYSISDDLKVKMVDCDDLFSFQRDDLIRKGKFKGPLTNSAEFFNDLKGKVIYLQ
jgi:hypothetical protein